MIFTIILYFIIKVLDVQDIPAFVAELSNATEKNDKEITQSPVTVQTIVGILVKVADVSQNIIINQPVMEVCITLCLYVQKTVKLWLI